MIRAFLFLGVRSVKNRLLAQARRLKRPRYLVFAIIGLSYFYLVAGRHWVSGLRFAGQAGSQTLPVLLVEVGAALLVMGSIVVAWCAPSPTSAITFSEAEIQYLFPAPISRRALVRWKLMRGQVGVLISLLIFAAVSGPYLAGNSRSRFLAGAWFAFATMQLHMMGIRMARHTLSRKGFGWGPRTAVALALTIGAAAACVAWVSRQVGPMDLDALRHLEGPGGLTEYAGRVFGSGPPWLITLPARLLVRPALAADTTAFLIAAPAALALLVLNYLWVLRSGVVLDEGALAAARKLEEHRQARARGRLGPARKMSPTATPFRLAPVGRPEVALLWKNLICSLRHIGGMKTFALLVGLFLLPAALATVARGRGLEAFAQVVGMMCAVTAVVLMVMGPSILRSDFRLDLLHIDLLKSLPLSGRSLLVGTLMAPVLVLTVAEWVLLAGFAALAAGSPGDALPVNLGAAALASILAILAPPINMVGALIHNAAMLLVPGWVALGPARATGVERMGQGMLTALGFALAMAVSFAPAALILGVAWFFASAFLGAAAALMLAAVPAVAVLAAEVWLGVAILGAYLDRFDPSREFDALARA